MNRAEKLNKIAAVLCGADDITVDCPYKSMDDFDGICSDISIELPAEIEARKKQYSYYRDLLLSFKELTT